MTGSVVENPSHLIRSCLGILRAQLKMAYFSIAVFWAVDERTSHDWKLLEVDARATSEAVAIL